MKLPLKIITISDTHIGHNRNPSNRMLTNIKTMFKENEKEFKECDILINTGDSSDNLMTTRSSDYKAYLELHLLLSGFCDKHNIMYIYLVGTPLHEMGQFSNMEFLILEKYPKLKFKTYTTLGIDYLEEFDMTLLHIPDEVIKDNYELELAVNKALKDYGVCKVDLALTHTLYTNHIDFPLENIRNPEFILSKVIHYVLNGHVHTHSIHHRMITIGSTDRLAHNEEECKGMGILTIRGDSTDYYNFIENKDALLFKTINKNYKLPKLKTVLTHLNKTNDLAYIQIHRDSDIAQSIIKDLNKEYENLIIELQKKNKKSKVGEIKTKEELNTLEITKYNVLTLLKEEVDIPDLETIINKHISLICGS